MGDVLKPLIAIAILVGLGGALLLAWRHRRLGIAFVVLTAVMVFVWVLAYAAISRDYRDADGWVDCWPNCTAYQNAVGGTFILGPAMFVLLGLFAAMLGAITGLRGGGERESRRPG
jgi:hypothetical protein